MARTTSHSSQEDSTSPNVGVTKDDFLQLGWCPHQFDRLQQIHTSETLHYFSSLDRRGYRPNSHHKCAKEPGCVANNVIQGEYKTAHTQSCCSCSFVSIDYTAIIDIIRTGGVPIVSIHVDAASSLHEPLFQLRVTPRKISTRYTVISHVWCDGLGNARANALPTCQVRRLYTQLLSLPREYESGVFNIGSLEVDCRRQSFMCSPKLQPPLFWMDTLCVPVQEKDKDLRTMAINQMASIYAAAVQELVLDAELMKCEAGAGAAALEILARVNCSAWMTRSWTLQEGVLARECVFQFKDRAVDPIHEWCLHGTRSTGTTRVPAVSFPLPTNEAHWVIYKELYNSLWHVLHQDWKSTYRKDPPIVNRANGGAWGSGGDYAAGKIRTLPSVDGLTKRGKSGLDEKDHFTMHLREEHRLKQLVDTWNELAYRSTTQAEDLHVIIANLLDFNADSIMKLPTREERMRAMILSFDLLPVSLFWNAGPKWSEDVRPDADGNNHWIPVEPSKSELSSIPAMRVTDQWLELDLAPGAIEAMPCAKVYLLHENGIDLSKQSTFLCAGLSELVYDITLPDGYQMVDCSMLGQTPYCLIIETSRQSSTSHSIRGALFRRMSPQNPDKEDSIQLTYCCPITLHPHERDIDPGHQHTVAEALATSINVAVKYDPIPHFTKHPRRLTRGPSLQGAVVAMMIILPVPAIAGVSCMVAFIVSMAQPPHIFTPKAQGLLIAFLVLHFGGVILGAAWLFFIDCFMYRIWLASFESDWVDEENKGWWGRLIRLEAWLGRLEHSVYTHIKNFIRALQKPFTPRSKNGLGDGRYAVSD